MQEPFIPAISYMLSHKLKYWSDAIVMSTICHKGDTLLSQALSNVWASLLWMKHMLRKSKQWLSYIYIFPILLALTACNDSNDDKTSTQPDGSKKPLMRCAP